MVIVFLVPLTPMIVGTAATILGTSAISVFGMVKVLGMKKDERVQAAKLLVEKENQQHDHEQRMKEIELEFKRLDIIEQNPESRNAVMKHTKLSYKHAERMMIQQSESRQDEDDEDDTEDDDTDHSCDQPSLVKASGGIKED